MCFEFKKLANYEDINGFTYDKAKNKMTNVAGLIAVCTL